MELRVEGKAAFAATGGRKFDAALPAVLFLPGAGMDHTIWSLQARYFAHHGRAVLALDLPGHGRSEGAPLLSVPAMAGWVADFLAAAGARQAAVVGHSMGALVALHLAASAPAQVARLALLGVADRMRVHPELMAAADGNRPLANELVASWGYGRAGHFGGHPAPGLWMMGGGIRLLERARPGVLANDLAACDAYDTAAAAAKIACPALLLSGDEDRMTPPARARVLAERIAGARALTLPGAGHMMMVERPDATTDALKGAV